MAKEELPTGYVESDGKTEVNGVVHPKGVIVGPHDRPKNVEWECPRCGSKAQAPADQSPVCEGKTLAMIDVKGVRGKKGAILTSGYDDDGDPVLVPGAVPTLVGDEGHGTTVMERSKGAA